MSIIPFGEWLPDQPDLGNPGFTELTNALPGALGYIPVPSAEPFTDALAGPCLGSIYAKDKDANVYVFAGSDLKIESLSGETWSDISRTATAAYDCGSTDRWDFVQFGEEVIATNFADEVQSITLGAAKFDDLGGSPPMAKHITVAKNFVLLANLQESAVNYPTRIRWSALGDATDWTPSAVTQSDFQDLIGGGGPINAIIGGDYVTVLQEHAIWRRNYIGAPIVWDFDEIETEIGLISRGAWAKVGNDIYFLSEKGFMVLHSGDRTAPIGWQKVDNYVLSDLDYGNLHRMSCSADIRSQRIYWSYPSLSATDGLADKVVVYDHSLKKWGFIDQEVESLAGAGQGGYTLDGLDALSASIDALMLSLDDIFYKGGSVQLAFFDADDKLCFFSGSPMAAEFVSKEVQLIQGRRSLMTANRPIIEGATTTVEIGFRDNQSDAVEWLPASTTNTNGRATRRKNARYHRVRIAATGEWTNALGFEPEFKPVGKR